MYNPPHFTESRPEILRRIITTHPLGILITATAGQLDANHLPFHFDPDGGPHGTLIAHVARANPLWRECPGGTPVLVIFRGAEGYISPNWYPGKAESHRLVPTWNYEVVHAHGMLTVRDDPKFVRGVVARLTRTHESSQPRPWKMSDSPAEFIDQMLDNIVGIEIAITRLEGKAKLSQNREARDQAGAAAALAQSGNDELAEAMRRGKL